MWPRPFNCRVWHLNIFSDVAMLLHFIPSSALFKWWFLFSTARFERTERIDSKVRRNLIFFWETLVVTFDLHRCLFPVAMFTCLICLEFTSELISWDVAWPLSLLFSLGNVNYQICLRPAWLFLTHLRCALSHLLNVSPVYSVFQWRSVLYLLLDSFFPFQTVACTLYDELCIFLHHLY